MLIKSAKGYLKSPLNYSGGKHKLLNQLQPYFPTGEDTFIDLFAGGLNVGINIESKNVFANDTNKHVISLYKYLKTNPLQEILNNLDEKIESFGLSNTSKNSYEFYGVSSKIGLAGVNKLAHKKLKDEYNKQKTDLLFYLLVVYSFNNQIRFNSKGEFNMPVNKRDFNPNVKKNLISFIERIQSSNINFSISSFDEFPMIKGFYYADPPYLISTASYNESGGWMIEHEEKLLNYLDQLHALGYKFALSNVIKHNGRVNLTLLDWSKKYKTIKLEMNYNNSSYHKINKSLETSEVLIINY